MRRITVSLVVVVLAASSACADIPSPDGSPRPVRPIEPIEIDRGPELLAKEKPLTVTANSLDRWVHLRVPRSLVKGKAAAAPVRAVGAADLRQRTVIAGLALSGAVVAAGLWLLRYRRRPVHLGKVAATTAATFLMFGCGLFRWLGGPTFVEAAPIPGAVCSGYVSIEPVDQDTIEVLLPKDMAAKIEAGPKGQ